MAIDRTVARRAHSDDPLGRKRRGAPSEDGGASRDATAESAPSLAIYMLSTFRVVVNGVELNGRLGGKGRSLLKILAASRERVLPRDALMEMVWPDTDPATGAISLKVAAHNLRSVLEPEKATGAPGQWIVFRDGTYGLNRDASVWIDVEELERLSRRGARAEALGDTGSARAAYREAEALYAGDFLEEDIYDDWTIIRREQLRDTYLDAVSRLAELAVMSGDHREAIRYCHKIIDTDPCREDAYRALMSSHGALNQHARAGAWYAVCRTMLKREMGVDPGLETIGVFESLFHDNP
jgi:DNA-binding SARP family transcriptional activator